MVSRGATALGRATAQIMIGAEDAMDAASQAAEPQGPLPAAGEPVASATSADGAVDPAAAVGPAGEQVVEPSAEASVQSSVEDEQPAEQLDRPLPEGVRRRVVGLAADALGGLPPADLPPSLRPYAKFTPARRAKYAGTALAAALEAEPVFRLRIADRLRLGQPDLVKALEAGQVPGAAEPWMWPPPPTCCAAVAGPGWSPRPASRSSGPAPRTQPPRRPDWWRSSRRS